MRYGAVERLMIRQEMEIMNDLQHPKLLQLHEAFDLTMDNIMVYIVEL